VWGPVDQQPVQDRPDVLVFRSSPLTKPVRFAGPISAELWVSADTPDADWIVKLLDVHPDGRAMPLATGVRRGSARDSELHRSPLVPGERYRLEVDLGHAAARIDAGHRLAVQIAGTSFPLFDRNLHTGEGPTGTRVLISHETVWHTPQFPSRIRIPTIDLAPDAGL
jgi:putative CocE/NonD family hydrolase